MFHRAGAWGRNCSGAYAVALWGGSELPIIPAENGTCGYLNEGSGSAGEPPAGAGSRGARSRRPFDAAHHVEHIDGNGRRATAPLGDRPRHLHQHLDRGEDRGGGGDDGAGATDHGLRHAVATCDRLYRGAGSYPAGEAGVRAHGVDDQHHGRGGLPPHREDRRGPFNRAQCDHTAAHDRSGGVRGGDGRLTPGDHGREHQRRGRQADFRGLGRLSAGGLRYPAGSQSVVPGGGPEPDRAGAGAARGRALDRRRIFPGGTAREREADAGAVLNDRCRVGSAADPGDVPQLQPTDPGRVQHGDGGGRGRLHAGGRASPRSSRGTAAASCGCRCNRRPTVPRASW